MRSFSKQTQPDPSVVDPYWKEVAFFSRWDTPTGNLPGTAATGYDLSQNNMAVGYTGTPAPAVSATQSKWGGYSLYKSGTSSGNVNINPTSTAMLAIGTQDFTIESWIYRESKATTTNYGFWCIDVTKGNAAAPNGAFEILFGGTNPDTGWTWGLYDGNTGGYGWKLHSTKVQAATWTHIAVTRSAGVLYLSHNGNTENLGAWTRSVNAPAAVGYTRIGTDAFNQYLWNFFVDDFRITIGAGRYTTSFAVPSKPLPTPTLP